MKQAMLAAIAVVLAGCQFIPHGHGSSVSESNGELTVNVGGEKVIGSGKIVEKTTGLDAKVIELQASTAFDIRVELGEPGVTLAVDDNLHAILPITVKNGVLELRPTQSFSTKTRPIAVVRTRDLNSIKLEGSCKLTGQSGFARDLKVTVGGASSADVKGEFGKLSLTANGASTVTASGSAKSVTGNGNGASSLELFGLNVETTDLELNGASNAQLNSRRISGTANGASTVSYKGDAKVDVTTHGASSVKTE